MRISQVTLRWVLGFLGALVSASALADVPAIKQDSKAIEVANTANSVLKLVEVRADGFAYKVVELDSALNQDLNSTILVLTGDHVGGAAGFESAFQVGPGILSGLKSVRVFRGRVEIVGYDPAHSTSLKKIYVKYVRSKRELTIQDR